MGLTTDGSARIDTVPPQLDLAQANPETKNTERADESGNTVAFESSTDKYLSGDVPTMRPINEDPSCEERRKVLGLHQASHSVAELDKGPKAFCFSVDTNDQDNDCCRISVRS